MNLHEYQAKQLFAKYGIAVPRGHAVWNVDEAISASDTLGGERWVVKAQVHAGGRGKSGGVRIVKGKAELIDAVKALIGTRLVTYQTDAQGQPVNEVLIEELSDIKRELYIGAVIDRSKKRVVFMLSTEGGVEIEKVAHETPEKILTLTVNPLVGILPYQAREAGFNLGLNNEQIKQLGHILQSLYQLFIDYDLSLLEVNPLIVNGKGDLVCLDGKINVDGSALYRQEALRQMKDPSQEDERENRAAQWELNYIALDGDIGCMVNGAGLAMATMDLIKLEGGNPANFLDVGGGATKERVTEAFKIILSDPNVKGVLVNIFGGIVRCDLIAEGIMGAVSDVGINVPVVVRLEGNNAALGAKKLSESGLNITPAKSFTDAAQQIVAMVKGKK